QSPRKEVLSPTESQPVLPAQPTHSSSELSKEQKARLHKAIEFFLEIGGEQHLKSVTIAWEKAKTAFVEQVGLDDPDPHVKDNL
nr:hypothetical protein [Tanacetum cinerariifolium]